MKIFNAAIFSEEGAFHAGTLCTKGETLSLESEDTVEIDGEGCYVIPGLVDIHIHGCNGHDFCEGTDAALDAMSDYLAKNGITSFVPTSMTLPEDVLDQIFRNQANYQNNHGALVLGINMEGPFLSLAKKGAQNGAYLKSPDIGMFERLNQAAKQRIRLVSIAPELENAMEFIAQVKEQTVISIAHTEADYDTAAAALSKGARHITHLYNAMPPFSHRAPGVIGAAAEDPNCNVELISDGVHVHPSVVRGTFQMFSPSRVILISDNMMATGMPDGQYELGGQAVTVLGNKATLKDGTIAGSATNLMDCLRCAVSFGIPLTQAITSATANPAKAIGVWDKLGSLTPGKLANFVLLDKDLHVKKVFIKGKAVPLQ